MLCAWDAKKVRTLNLIISCHGALCSCLTFSTRRCSRLAVQAIGRPQGRTCDHHAKQGGIRAALQNPGNGSGYFTFPSSSAPLPSSPSPSTSPSPSPLSLTYPSPSLFFFEFLAFSLFLSHKPSSSLFWPYICMLDLVQIARSRDPETKCSFRVSDIHPPTSCMVLSGSRRLQRSSDDRTKSRQEARGSYNGNCQGGNRHSHRWGDEHRVRAGSGSLPETLRRSGRRLGRSNPNYFRVQGSAFRVKGKGFDVLAGPTFRANTVT